MCVCVILMLAHVSMYAHPDVIVTKPIIMPLHVAPKSILKREREREREREKGSA